MTFLKRSGYTSIGGTLLLCVASFQWAIVVNGFVGWCSSAGFMVSAIRLDIRAVINALFSVVSVMITFGVVIGKLSLVEMMFAAVWEVALAGVNNYLSNGRGTLLETVDIGGSIFIHMFGAYFGMAFAWALRDRHTRKPVKLPADAVPVLTNRAGTGNGNGGDSTSGGTGLLSSHPSNAATYTSDLFAMVGTVFLFIYWPSFNAAFASISNHNHGPAQMRALINTMLAQAAGAYSAFLFSRILRRSTLAATTTATTATTTTPPPPQQQQRGKFHMTDVQNATLAAGVAIGASADQWVSVGGAMAVGVLAAWVSVVGYVWVQPWLERRWRWSDTCGVHNLHGMPGLLGGLVSVVVTAVSAYSSSFSSSPPSSSPSSSPSTPTTFEGIPVDQWFPHGRMQFAYQLSGIAITLTISIVGGLLTAGLCQLARPLLNTLPDYQQTSEDDDNGLFTDDVEWFVAPERGDEQHDLSSSSVQAGEPLGNTSSPTASSKANVAALDKVFVIQKTVVAEKKKSLEKPTVVEEIPGAASSVSAAAPKKPTPVDSTKGRKPVLGTAVLI